MPARKKGLAKGGLAKVGLARAKDGMIHLQLLPRVYVPGEERKEVGRNGKTQTVTTPGKCVALPGRTIKLRVESERELEEVLEIVRREVEGYQ